MSTRTRGVAASLVASALFGLIYLVSGLVDASTDAVFGWRVVLTAVCYGAVTVHGSGRRRVREFWAALTSTRAKPLVLVVLSLLVGLQLWMFAWTPVHGHALDASLGYLLLPIVLVLVGRFVFATPVTPLQWTSVVVAAGAVAVKIAFTPAVSWVTWAICLGYAAYFTLRRHARLDQPAAFGVEVLLLTPLATVLILTGEGPSSSLGHAAVLAAGLIGALAMSAYLAASRQLSMPVFGLLSYVEPVILVGVALVLGETPAGMDVVVYAVLALALTLLAVDGFRATRRVTTARVRAPGAI